MRIVVDQEHVYRYATPASSVTQILRMTPRSHDGQHVVRWRIDVDRDVRLSEAEDAFGNITHAFQAAGPIDQITVRVEGEVETIDRAGVLGNTIERFPPSLYLRDTPLTRVDAALAAFASGIGGPSLPELDFCHGLMDALHGSIERAPDAEAVVGAGPTLTDKRGRAADIAHVFIACARSRQIPARFVSGHHCEPDNPASAGIGHGWAEAWIAGLGWIGFDASVNLCPKDGHIRVAMGLDHLGASPVRGARLGGDGELLDIRVKVRELFGDRQAQRQQQG